MHPDSYTVAHCAQLDTPECRPGRILVCRKGGLEGLTPSAGKIFLH
jgi:hypothetical protein